MIEFDHVSHRYDNRLVLNDINLSLAEQRIGIVGANGSGKSTLARLCHGLITPTSGRVLVNGVEPGTRQSVGQVGFVFQDPDLQILMPTVAEDLAFGLRRFKLPASEVTARVDHWLEAYDLTEHRDHPAHLLSGGQKQLLAIAAILITEPDIVIFDEPTTLLDLRNKIRVSQAISELDQQVIIVSHDLEIMSTMDRVLVIDHGGVVADNQPQPALEFYRRLSQHD
jgi:biotin transport system ATP-binding protein